MLSPLRLPLLSAIHFYFFSLPSIALAPLLALLLLDLIFHPHALTPCRSARRSHTFDSSVLLCFTLSFSRARERAVAYRPFLTLPFSLVCFFLPFSLSVPLSFSSFRSVTFSLPLACSHFCCSPSRVPSAIKSAEAAPRRLDWDRERKREMRRTAVRKQRSGSSNPNLRFATNPGVNHSTNHVRARYGKGRTPATRGLIVNRQIGRCGVAGPQI